MYLTIKVSNFIVTKLRVLSLTMSLFLAALCPGTSSFAVRLPVFDSDTSPASNRRPIAVRDGIEMVRLADYEYFSGASSMGRVAKFSPDGKRFVVVLQKGNLEKNINEFSLYLFATKDALRSPRPVLLTRFSSSSNREGISNVEWLDDNETLVFLGENVWEVAQVYTFNIQTRSLIKRNTHSTPTTPLIIT